MLKVGMSVPMGVVPCWHASVVWPHMSHVVAPCHVTVGTCIHREDMSQYQATVVSTLTHRSCATVLCLGGLCTHEMLCNIGMHDHT